MLVNVGNGNLVSWRKVVEVRTPGRGAVKKTKTARSGKRRCIDACAGQTVQSLIYLDSSHVVMSPLTHRLLCESLMSYSTLAVE